MEEQRNRGLQVEEQRAQDAALQACLDQISQLLADKDRPLHKARPGDPLSSIARARTLTVLPRLDGSRKRSVLQFLYECGLITKDRVVTELRGADLSKVFLFGADFHGADLSRVLLSEAVLDGANLSRANLRNAWGINNEQLYQQAGSLAGATMPDGQKYEEWLKDKAGRGEDGG